MVIVSMIIAGVLAWLPYWFLKGSSEIDYDESCVSVMYVYTGLLIVCALITGSPRPEWGVFSILVDGPVFGFLGGAFLAVLLANRARDRATAAPTRS